MGTMNKLREHTGVILWILVISFGVIWVLQDSGAFDVVGNMSGTNIIYVDGEPITYDEYARALDQQLQQYQTQTGESMPPQMVDLQRDRVFDALVENKLMEREMDRLGITVTDQEVIDMVLGENPHPVITMYFGDQQGGVNRTMLQNFIDDPQSRDQWIQLEQYLRSEKRRAKLQGLIASTVRVSDADVRNEYERRNRSVNAEYVALRYANIPDDSVTVTDRDLQRFYNDHKDEFERKTTYTVNYVTRSKDATAQDSALVADELQRVKPRFAEAQDDSLFLIQNASERPYSGAFVSAAGLDPQVADAVFPNPTAGTVVGPVIAGGQGHLIKIKDVRPAESAAVKARHILISAPEGNAEARAQARRRIEDIQRQLQAGADFAAVALAQSDDPGSRASGGDLGWFSKGRMVPAFENAALGAPVGSVVGPVETQFGYHLIQVMNKASQEVRVADYAMQIRPDVETLSGIQEQLDDLHYYAGESGNFAEEAGRRNLEVQQVQIEAEQEFIPGIGNSRALMNFLANAEEGDLSDVIELNNQFIVAQVEEITPEGHRPLADVRSELEPRVRVEKKKEILRERLRKALAQHGFPGLAGPLSTAVQSAQGLTYSGAIVPGLGREMKLIGTAFGLEPGKTSGVVEGENAVFVVRTTSVSEPPPLTDAVKEQLRQELLQQRRQVVVGQWLASLREKADVEDHRSRFQQ